MLFSSTVLPSTSSLSYFVNKVKSWKMGGLVSGSANRYESGSEEFKEEQQPVVAGVNGLFGRRRNSRFVNC